MSNLSTVQATDEAFDRGDIPFILERLADDVRWDPCDPSGPAHGGAVPQLVRRDGRADGTVVELRHVVDTAKHLAANTP